jgi:hypothetical protein
MLYAMNITHEHLLLFELHIQMVVYVDRFHVFYQIRRYQRASGITFIRYVQNRKIGKINNLKFWEQKQHRA